MYLPLVQNVRLLLCLYTHRLPKYDASVPDVSNNLLNHRLAQELLRPSNSGHFQCIQPDESCSRIVGLGLARGEIPRGRMRVSWSMRRSVQGAMRRQGSFKKSCPFICAVVSRLTSGRTTSFCV